MDAAIMTSTLRKLLTRENHEQAALASCSYDALDPNVENIRLLTLQPGLKNDGIKCDLKTLSLRHGYRDEKGQWLHKFTAVSWSWGEPGEPKRTITVNGEQHSVPINMFDCLTALRQPHESRLLWVDCICINQQDASEKNTQIPLMIDIFEKASQVLIWLGREGQDSESVMDAIRSADMNRLQDAKFYKALTRLLRRRWFSRLWVLQEFAIPRNEPVVVCGSGKPVPWSELVQAYEIGDSARMRQVHSIEDSRQRISKMITNETLEGTVVRFLWGSLVFAQKGRFFLDYIIYMTAERPHCHNPTITSNVYLDCLQTLRENFRPFGISTLSNALRLSRRSACSDECDRVYGLLGVLDKDVKTRFLERYPISYGEPPAKVYKDATVWMLENEGASALQIYDVFPRNSVDQRKTPSWMPDFADGRRTSRRLFNLKQSVPFDSNPRISQDKRTLWTKCIEVDVVEEMLDFDEAANHAQRVKTSMFAFWVVRHILIISFWILGHFEPQNFINELMIRALYVAATCKAFRNISSMVRAKCGEEVLDQLSRTLTGRQIIDTKGRFVTWSLIEEELERYSRERMNLGAIANMIMVLLGKDVTLFTDANGHFGIANASVKKGDRLVLLFPGPFVPFIVRDRQEKVEMVAMAEIPEDVRLKKLSALESQQVDIGIV